MQLPDPTPAFRRRLRGRVMSTLSVLFLVIDALGKVARVPAVIEATARMGFPAGAVMPLGLVLLACTILYAVPRTALIGALLLTGYLGGAVAAHVRIGDPFVSHTLFPVYIAALLWAGLLLRDDGLRALVVSRVTARHD